MNRGLGGGTATSAPSAYDPAPFTGATGLLLPAGVGPDGKPLAVVPPTKTTGHVPTPTAQDPTGLLGYYR